jgi:hypothetical protein
MAITVCPYPPGTIKWNKIELRLFSFISLNWRGRPLVNYETVVNLIDSLGNFYRNHTCILHVWLRAEGRSHS